MTNQRKLTNEQAAEIRSDPRSWSALAAIYGVDRKQIGRIKNGTAYKDSLGMQPPETFTPGERAPKNKWRTPESRGISRRDYFRMYDVWHLLVRRCTNKTHKDYYAYGARGITVCERWRDSFDDFLDDVGVVPPGMTIDRQDNDKGYCKDNLRLATRAEQVRNRRITKTLTFRGVTKPLGEWAREVGIDHRIVNGRIRYGWTVERALTTPLVRRVP